MDLKQIEKLMNAMNKAEMHRLSIKEKGFELELEKPPASSVITTSAPLPAAAPVAPAASAPAPAKTSADEGQQAAPGTYITSPMVGTFYSSPSPDDPPFVKEGDKVEKNTVVCIVEAMKVMNEVKALVEGKVVEVLVKNGDPVEFGTNLYKVVS